MAVTAAHDEQIRKKRRFLKNKLQSFTFALHIFSNFEISSTANFRISALVFEE